MKKNFTTMKKRYYRPEIEELEIYTSTVLALSLIEGDDGEGDDDRGHSSGQKGDEFRGDWDNIWEGM